MGERYENIVLGAHYVLTLGHLRDWHVLRVICGHCHRVGYIHPIELRRRHYADNMPLNELKPRFRCTKCGNKRGNSWETCRLPRD